MEWNVFCACYDPDTTPQQMHAVSTLLLVDIETAVTTDLVAFARSLHAMDNIGQQPLFSASFRRNRMTSLHCDAYRFMVRVSCTPINILDRMRFSSKELRIRPVALF